MYKLCIFAGTTEGRKLVEFLSGQPVQVTACVATDYGETLLKEADNLTISAKRLTQEEMEQLFAAETLQAKKAVNAPSKAFSYPSKRL